MDFVWRDDAAFQPPRVGFGVALKLFIAVTLGGFFLGLLLSTVSPQELVSAFRRVRGEWLIAALAGLAAAYGLRALRWTLMLRQAGSAVRFRDAAVPLMGSAALDNLLPLGAGDAIRMIGLQSFAGAADARSFGTLSLEKRLDICVGGAVALGSVLLWRPGPPNPLFFPGLVAVAAALLIFAAAWAKRARPGLGRSWIARPGRGRMTAAAGLAGLSLAAFLADACFFLAVAEALRMAPALPIAVLAAGLVGASLILPTPPARLGVFDYVAALAAAAFGAGPVQAVAFALLSHAVVWAATTVAGWRLLASADRIGVARGPQARPV